MFSTALSDPAVILGGVVLATVQFVAALPWLWAIDPKGFRAAASSLSSLAYTALGLVGAGVAVAAYVGYKSDASNLTVYGRYLYGAVLHLQLIIAAFLLLPQILMLVWPKGGVVAFAAFRESCRQPMFWLITGTGTVAIWISVAIPYFTFGDDYKMMKQIGFDIVMLAATLFGVLAASMSISEEIEGRTAVTLMSKPVNRRQFLVGKFLGIVMASLIMSMLLSWTLTYALRANREFDSINNAADPTDPLAGAERQVVDPLTFQAQRTVVPPFRAAVPSLPGKAIATGAGLWFSDVVAHSLGIALGFGQVLILVALASALATRVSFVVNLTLCLVVFFLGNLAPVVVQVTQQQGQGGNVAVGLVGFLGRLFDALLPSLASFNMGRAIIRESPLDLWQFGWYVLTVTGYSLIYTTIALLGGLLAFEDRDLA